jgi:putative nucleotidyltransferase with HDIG domain
MDINVTKSEWAIFRKVAEAAEEQGYPCYLVGGFVRDKILGRSTKDVDFVCVGDALRLAEAVSKKIKPHSRVSFFKTFGTAHIKLPDGTDLEFVGARKESYRSLTRNPEVEPGTITDDQNRRDFTINTLAISLNDDDFWKLIDPFNGMEDISQRLIRTPLDPLQTFSDDPLRMMRAIRFAAQLEFHIFPETLQAIKQMAERIRIITQERITDELNKIILTRKPSVGFRLLYETGLLSIIFPQMVDLAGAEYIDGHGHKDNFFHTLQVLDNVSERSDNLWLRWAAVLHDIAKPATKRFEEGHGWTIHGHEVVGSRMVPKIFKKHNHTHREPKK